MCVPGGESRRRAPFLPYYEALLKPTSLRGLGQRGEWFPLV